jgi:hypothetical protein
MTLKNPLPPELKLSARSPLLFLLETTRCPLPSGSMQIQVPEYPMCRKVLDDACAPQTPSKPKSLTFFRFVSQPNARLERDAFETEVKSLAVVWLNGKEGMLD